MKKLSEISDYFIQTFTPDELEALKLVNDDAHELEAYFQLETGDFDCIGFVGPGGKVTKFAEIDKYKALLILENKIRKELSQFV